MDCCNISIMLSMIPMEMVTIPRTVWTVATSVCSTVGDCAWSYDTANGMDCCNFKVHDYWSFIDNVTIPRTVWTVATLWKEVEKLSLEVTIPRTVWTVATMLSALYRTSH